MPRFTVLAVGPHAPEPAFTTAVELSCGEAQGNELVAHTTTLTERLSPLAKPADPENVSPWPEAGVCVMVRPLGATVSTVTVRLALATEALPAASVEVAETEWEPLARADVVIE